MPAVASRLVRRGGSLYIGRMFNPHMKGNALIGQSGGPTSVINASLVGVVDGCKKVKLLRDREGMPALAFSI